MEDISRSELMRVQQQLFKVRKEKHLFNDVQEENFQEVYDENADPDQNRYSEGQREDLVREIYSEDLECETKEDLLKDVLKQNDKMRKLLDQQIEINQELERMLREEKQEKLRQNEQLWVLKDQIRELKRKLWDPEEAECSRAKH